MLRAAAGLVFLAVAVVGVLQLYDAAASGGLLGSDAQAKYVDQSGTFGVLLGGRSEVLASTQAIIDSPILGHGSWAKDFKYVDLLAQRLSSLGYEVGAGPSDVGLIPAHSYLMGSWVWAGFLGGLFWLAILGIAVWLLANLYSFRVELAPLLVFSATLLVWAIAFSPYGFSARITAPYGVALCLLGLRLVRGTKLMIRRLVSPVVRRDTRSPGLGVLQTAGGPRGTFGRPPISQVAAHDSGRRCRGGRGRLTAHLGDRPELQLGSLPARSSHVGAGSGSASP